MLLKQKNNKNLGYKTNYTLIKLDTFAVLTKLTN
jgi:hypothetical protein